MRRVELLSEGNMNPPEDECESCSGCPYWDGCEDYDEDTDNDYEADD